MNAWPFVIAAYGVCLTATVALLTWAFLSMRRSEAAAETIKRK